MFPSSFVSWKLDNCTHIDWFLGDGSHTFDSHLSISAKNLEEKISAFSSTCKDLHCDGIKIWLLSILNSKHVRLHWPELSRGYSHVELAAKKRDWGSARVRVIFFRARFLPESHVEIVLGLHHCVFHKLILANTKMVKINNDDNNGVDYHFNQPLPVDCWWTRTGWRPLSLIHLWEEDVNSTSKKPTSYNLSSAIPQMWAIFFQNDWSTLDPHIKLKYKN